MNVRSTINVKQPPAFVRASVGCTFRSLTGSFTRDLSSRPLTVHWSLLSSYNSTKRESRKRENPLQSLQAFQQYVCGLIIQDASPLAPSANAKYHQLYNFTMLKSVWPPYMMIIRPIKKPAVKLQHYTISDLVKLSERKRTIKKKKKKKKRKILRL